MFAPCCILKIICDAEPQLLLVFPWHGNDWMVALLPQEQPHHPTFLQLSHRNLQLPLTISTHNKHLGSWIMVQNTHTHSVNIGSSNSNCGDPIPSDNKTLSKSDEDAQIMRLHSPLEPDNWHQGVCTNRSGGVGWLLGTGLFRG